MSDGILTRHEEERLRTFRDNLALEDSSADSKTLTTLNRASSNRIMMETRLATISVHDGDQHLQNLNAQPAPLGWLGGRGGSTVVAQGPYGRLRTLGRTRWWGEDTARDPRGPDWREFGSVFSWPGAGRAPSGREWNRLQPGENAAELLLPRPAPGKMQGEPPGHGEEPPPEGLGGHHLLAQAAPSIRVHRWIRAKTRPL